LEPVDEDGEKPLEMFFDEFKNPAHEIIRSKTHEVIRARYPSLAGAVAKRRSSSYAMCGGRLLYIGRSRWF